MSKGIAIDKMRLVDWQYTKAIFTTVITLAEGQKIHINDCQVNDGRNGLYVKMPQRPYEKDGEKKYANVVYLEGEKLQNSVTDAALAEYHKKAGPPPKQSPMAEDDWPF